MNIRNSEHSSRPWPGRREHISLTEEQPIDIHDTLAEMIKTVAPLKIDLVLEGETGTGKDTLARKIHQLSGCRGKLVAVNCAAIPETLAESELFGINNGAYTGAGQARAGYVEAADNGILFLDEIDSMPLSLQAKMLRVLENRGVERLGGTRFTPVNMRVIVATQTPLLTLVERGSFRRDLYFRLNTVSIQLQPLRARIEVIIPMFRSFIQKAASTLQCAPREITQEHYECLLSYSWPGNIRELKAAAERFVLGLPPLDLPCHCGQERPQLKELMRRIEKNVIYDCLVRHGHSIDDAAQELGIPLRTLYHRIKLLNVNTGRVIAQ
ncbi:sigma 54-interacting transcriptional regulator [Erwinia amylovora]|uniref:Sigma-54-dependent enhancer-binding protein HrpS n=3 Tax=Erwinia amylovora TaxID=552 RepID=A0A831A168_ERWAM|nr:sigma 54-interacting transcriptional regulator [Erwinia amylovora]CCP01834.1 Sigma-54-dependent enhancer-binding protein HrpS [Erwinia amylovora Ea644]CCP05857.1 Sigma-54-dependent enhancer-binding protein HrpS [Erwinia amylovora MR1]CDK14139.1 Sigma-54-dependent enhancer-binding protein HrpS [Erwinia amylovora LA635]CDK17506.1 Sigma-54-dependent enhancer-binding protein HrpS [Erwinia amylovora LA636]CDK20875.1 Sigma-54-dependent enhancer-binding protein HrpS [Erwinia amylovora LA637]